MKLDIMSDAWIAEPLEPEADALASRGAPWWDAGGKAFSILYWGCIALFAMALGRTQSLPFVDYPQHLALARALRLAFAHGPAGELYDTNVASYNSLFHVLVALTNSVFSIDTAGKVVLAGYFLLFGAGVLALLKATGRPRARAFLALTVLAGYFLVWGFVNYALGMALGLFVLARVLSVRRSTWRHDVLTALLALLTAYAHLLAWALVYMLLLVVLLADMQLSEAPFPTRLGKAFRRGLPLLPAILYVAIVYLRQELSTFRNFEYAEFEGSDVYALVKFRHFVYYATGLTTVGREGSLLTGAFVLLGISAVLRDVRDRVRTSLPWLLVVATFAYFVLPHTFWATNYVFQRLTVLVVVLLVMTVPRAMPQVEQALRYVFVSVGVTAAGNFVAAMGQARVDTADLDQVIEAAPAGRRLTALVYGPQVRSFAQPILLHVGSYYEARKDGESAASFKRIMSLPVHYRADKMPPLAPRDFEWQPERYTPGAAYAKAFDLVLLKSLSGDDPRQNVWGERALDVEVLEHRGAWWLLDARRIP
jgi:hypothetical protein